MPPLSQKAAGQATLSSFFKPKVSPSQSSFSITKHSQPDPANASSGHPRPSSSSSFEPPHKKPRFTQNEKPRKETLDRMGKWKFETIQSQEPSSDGGALQGQKDGHAGARHQAFRNKLLGSNFAIDRHARNQMQIDQMSSRDPFFSAEARDIPEGGSDDAIVIDDDDDDDNTPNRFEQFASDSASSSRPSKTKGKAKSASAPEEPTYTPLEKQILALKSAHPGILLIIEVGYKLKFYGEDARIASKELNIMCFPERNLLTAMIPVHRLHIHVKRLISAGHKVGVVRQIETRALKAASKNAYTPFERKLTALYTASTWIDDLSSTDESLGLGEGYTNQPKSLMAIVEQSEGGNGAEDRVSIGLVSVEVNTGHLTYDQFSDAYARSELETRIAHLAPAEVLVPRQLTRPTAKVISYLLGGGAEGGVRLERLDTKPDYNQAFEAVTKFYRDQGLTSSSSSSASTTEPAKEGGDSVMNLILTLPHLSLIALALTIKHLQSFQLESICTLSTNFSSFASRSTMLLNSNTLANLEIFRNADDGKERGSLIWLLDKCKTAFGRRLLRKWVSRPLTDIAALEERLDAVQALVEGKSYVLRTLPTLLQGLPDLERGLARMTYGRATPTELATVLLSLNRVTQEFKPEESSTWSLPTFLHEHVLTLTSGKAAVQTYLNQISIQSARANKKADLFPDPDLYPAIQEAKDNMAIVESQLREELKAIRKLLHRPSLEFVSVAGVDYLIEVRVADAKKVPPEWLRVSATKSMVRFHTPDVIRLVKLRDQHQETLDAEADAAFRDFVQGMCQSEYVVLRNVVGSLATLDVLVSLAQLGASSGYTRPEFVQPTAEGRGGVPIEIQDMRHPILEATSPLPYIPNNISLAAPNNAMLLTGCNMGGKSSLARTLGLLVILAQIGSFLPCSSARLGVHDSVFVRMGARDRLFAGKSTFMVEVSETAEILRSVSARSLVILDELGRGTSTYDGLCIAYGVLEYLLAMEARMPNVVFISHYFQLGELEHKYDGRIANWHMAFIETSDEGFDQWNPAEDEGEETEAGGGNIEFLYKLRRGIASKSFGIHCARLAGLPKTILQTAESISADLETKHSAKAKAKAKRNRTLLHALFKHAAINTDTLHTLNHAIATSTPPHR